MQSAYIIDPLSNSIYTDFIRSDSDSLTQIRGWHFNVPKIFTELKKFVKHTKDACHCCTGVTRVGLGYNRIVRQVATPAPIYTCRRAAFRILIATASSFVTPDWLSACSFCLGSILERLGFTLMLPHIGMSIIRYEPLIIHCDCNCYRYRPATCLEGRYASVIITLTLKEPIQFGTGVSVTN